MIDNTLAPSSEWSAVAEQALGAAKRLGADEAEAYLSAHEMIEVGLEKGEVQLVRTASEQGLGLRVYRNRSLGFASANTFDDAAIREIAEGAAMQAKASPGDPGGELPSPQPLHPVAGLADPALRKITVEQAVAMGRAALDGAMNADPRVRIDGGALVIYHGKEGVISSKGVACADEFTAISLNLMGMAVDGDSVGSMDYDYAASRRAGTFDPAAFGREMGLAFLTALHPRHAKSFKGPVLFHPRAVVELILGALLGGACAESVQKGASPLAGKLGERIAPEFFTLADDGTLPGAYGSSSFDREGMPHQRLPIIEAGVLRNFLYRHGSAVQEGRRSTGHAAGSSRSAPHTGVTNLIIDAGATPLAALRKGLDYSLLVTRASGHPNPITGEFSVAVKGAQLIENGEITGPVTEVMMRGNAFDLLKQISALSLEREERPGLVCPWLLIDGVDVTAA
jgi:PmbA protein